MNRLLLAGLCVAALALSGCNGEPKHEDVTRYPIPNSNFPISLAVKVPAGKALLYLSGQVPTPANAEAEKNSAAYWGDTYAQTVAVMKRIESALEAQGLGMGDVIKMQAFLVGDPALGGVMDFAGFMKGYTEYFGTAAQGQLPVRTTVQVAGLAQSGMLVEIEVVAVVP